MGRGDGGIFVKGKDSRSFSFYNVKSTWIFFFFGSYKDKVKDYNFGSLIRMDARDEYAETNTIFGAFLLLVHFQITMTDFPRYQSHGYSFMLSRCFFFKDITIVSLCQLFLFLLIDCSQQTRIERQGARVRKGGSRERGGKEKNLKEKGQ